MKRLPFLLIILVWGLSACGAPAPDPQPASAPTNIPQIPEEMPEKEAAMSFLLTSPAFAHEEAIPAQYSCDGDDSSPQLNWTPPPAGTESLALIVDDPDAPMGTWVHWVLYNIPADATGLAASLPEDVGVQGKNSWNRLGYGGPCPPSGTHRYYFKLYALDTLLDLQAGATKKDLLSAMGGHILEEAELMGTYTR